MNKNSTSVVRTAYLQCVAKAFQGISLVKLLVSSYNLGGGVRSGRMGWTLLVIAKCTYHFHLNQHYLEIINSYYSLKSMMIFSHYSPRLKEIIILLFNICCRFNLISGQNDIT